MTGRILVGTSGWSYRGWIGVLYPERTPASRMLQAYAAAGLRTVEAHNTYRRRPTPESVAAWLAALPSTFRIAPKAHAAITHQRDLEGVEDRIGEFFAALEPLGERLGPALFSLPHRQPDLERLDRLLDAIPAGHLAAFELAPPWHVAEIASRVADHGATLVTTDRDDTAGDGGGAIGPFSYVRLRRERYTDADLDRWAQRLRARAETGGDVYAYVRHDDDGDAPRWALRLQERL